MPKKKTNTIPRIVYIRPVVTYEIVLNGEVIQEGFNTYNRAFNWYTGNKDRHNLILSDK